MTRFPELFNALAEEFQGADVRVRTQAGRQLSYITARTVMNRLDDVLGPENWWDEYVPGEHSVVCKLTIRLPDGSTLTKEDAGGYAGMADQGDDDKSGFSDAFKRAAVKLGVGRHLYKDGVVVHPPRDRPDPGPDGEVPRTVGELLRWAKALGAAEGTDLEVYLGAWARKKHLAPLPDWSADQVALAFDAIATRVARFREMKGALARTAPPAAPQGDPSPPSK